MEMGFCFCTQFVFGRWTMMIFKHFLNKWNKDPDFTLCMFSPLSPSLRELFGGVAAVPVLLEEPLHSRSLLPDCVQSPRLALSKGKGLRALLLFQCPCVWGHENAHWCPQQCRAFSSLPLPCIPLLPSPAWQPGIRSSPAAVGVHPGGPHDVLKCSVSPPA